MNTNAILALLLWTNSVFLTTNTMQIGSSRDSAGGILFELQASQYQTNIQHLFWFSSNEPPYKIVKKIPGPWFDTNWVEVQNFIEIPPPMPELPRRYPRPPIK